MTDQENPERFYQALGRTIQVLRIDQGIDRKDFADRAGISYSYLTAIENGTRKASSKVLMAVADALGLRSHQLLADAQERHDRQPPSPKLALAPSLRMAVSPLPSMQQPRMRHPWFHGETADAVESSPVPVPGRAHRTPDQTGGDAGFLAAIARLLPGLSSDDRAMLLNLARKLSELG
jgi:transcriptional regulator with XRE-family HTH domain